VAVLARRIDALRVEWSMVGFVLTGGGV
jgi:hypothetical protein